MAGASKESGKVECDKESRYYCNFSELKCWAAERLYDTFKQKSIYSAINASRKVTSRIYSWVYELITGDEPTPGNEIDGNHDDITQKVFRRLQLRHTVLGEVEGVAGTHRVNKVLCELYPEGLLSSRCEKCGGTADGQSVNGAGEAQHTEKKPPAGGTAEAAEAKADLHYRSDPAEQAQGNQQAHDNVTSCADSAQSNGGSAKSGHHFLILPPALRTYNLAVTDLFVEKALAYMNRKARSYQRAARMLMILGTVTVVLAAAVAYGGIKPNEAAIQSVVGQGWLGLLFAFAKSFTFYGLMVLIAVYSYRMAQAMFDQAERIKDRRHALRQGRLFVHLNGGRLTLEEMEQAFNWNVSQANAFSKFNPEAQAPWGNVVKELLVTLREVSKSSLQVAKLAKKGDA
ncbi:hypothetical protein [Fundidesulfovibrio agrisoli]|uniref:hypothetical protein n=1 Tax=Fundidesulfovibrio agrisoli TaxID=2922717 RepID=UPI001FAC286B|nr:hypothetical protein [Fundidesulfovibrio agrisoli]